MQMELMHAFLTELDTTIVARANGNLARVLEDLRRCMACRIRWSDSVESSELFREYIEGPIGQFVREHPDERQKDRGYGDVLKSAFYVLDFHAKVGRMPTLGPPSVMANMGQAAADTEAQRLLGSHYFA